MPRLTLVGGLRALVVALAALLAVVVLPRLGAQAPDLVVLVVVSAALRRGPAYGAVVGLLAGWVVDILPPGGQPVGATALVYAAAGLAAGWSRRFGDVSPLVPVVGTALAAAVVQGVRLLVAAAQNVPVPVVPAGLAFALTVVAGVLLVPLLMVGERALVRRGLA